MLPAVISRFLSMVFFSAYKEMLNAAKIKDQACEQRQSRNLTETKG